MSVKVEAPKEKDGEEAKLVPPENSQIPHAPTSIWSPLRRAACFMEATASWVWNCGEACMLIAALMFSFATAFVKITNGRVPVLELALIRCGASIVLSMLMAWELGLLKQWRIFGTRKSLPLLVLRGALGAFAMITGYVCLYNLPISTAVVIGQINPPVTALAAYVILREPLGIKGSLGCVASFVGVVVTAHPPWLFGGHEEWGPVRLIGAFAGLASAVLAAGAYIAMRNLKGEPSIVVAYWFHLGTVAVTLVPVAASWPQATTLPSLIDLSLLLAVAVLGFFALIIFTRSFCLLTAGKASALNFSGVVWAYCWDIFFFGQKLTLMGALGTLLVLGGVLLVAVRPKGPKPQGSQPGVLPATSGDDASKHGESCPVCKQSPGQLGSTHRMRTAARTLSGDIENAPLLEATVSTSTLSSSLFSTDDLMAGHPAFVRSMLAHHGVAAKQGGPVLQRLLHSHCADPHCPSCHPSQSSFSAWAGTPSDRTPEGSTLPSEQTTGATGSDASTLVRSCTYCGAGELVALANAVGAVRATATLRRAPSSPLMLPSEEHPATHEVWF